jgi:hypothetical protein
MRRTNCCGFTQNGNAPTESLSQFALSWLGGVSVVVFTISQTMDHPLAGAEPQSDVSFGLPRVLDPEPRRQSDIRELRAAIGTSTGPNERALLRIKLARELARPRNPTELDLAIVKAGPRADIWVTLIVANQRGQASLICSSGGFPVTDWLDVRPVRVRGRAETGGCEAGSAINTAGDTWKYLASLATFAVLTLRRPARISVITERGIPVSRATAALLTPRASSRKANISAGEASRIECSVDSYCATRSERISSNSLSAWGSSGPHSSTWQFDGKPARTRAACEPGAASSPEATIRMRS